MDAGRHLGLMLMHLKPERPLVLALPRGGVPVGYEVARQLDAEFDVLVVRKVGVPGDEELAMGAVGSGGAVVRNEDVIAGLQIPDEVFDTAVAREAREVVGREQLYRGIHPRVAITGRSVVLIDDGLATGATMRAAIRGTRQLSPRRIVVAVPVASRSTCTELASEADDIVCAVMPDFFLAVGQAYEDFGEVADDEVRELLDRAAIKSAARPRPAVPKPPSERATHADGT